MLSFGVLAILRISLSYLLWRENFEKTIFKILFGVLFFCELGFGLIYIIPLIERGGIVGKLAVLAFIIYYVIGFPFIKKLQTV